MRFAVLSSGSKANCTFFEAAGVRLLIDCGLSGTQAEKRLNSIGVPADTIDAILVTHEHHDHIHGVATMSRRFKIPVYINDGPGEHLTKLFGMERFITGVNFEIGALRISPFSIPHDALDPVGFTFLAEGMKFSQATDLGKVTPLVRDAMSGCNAMVLESNHDPVLLHECDYSWELKQRIASTHGHLSNPEAAELLSEVLHPELTHVVLGHLSENSNTPEVALRTVCRSLEQLPNGSRPSICCGSIAHTTPMFEVGESSLTSAVA